MSPTYSFVCDRCKTQFEEFQKMSSKSTAKCPKCGKTTNNRLIGAGGGIIFKGPGFYAVDYREKKNAEKK